MITNATILAECKKKLTNPTFSITDYTSSIGKASYDKPYGLVYIPTPRLAFPTGVTFEMCLGQTTEAPKNGIPFKFYMPDDWDYSGSQCWIVFSGDKFLRTTEYSLSPISDGGGTDLYKTDRVITWHSWELSTWKLFPNLLKIHYGYTTFYYRIKIEKSGYYSAWSELSSFSTSFREAEQGVLGTDGDGGSVTDETGYMFDGVKYW